METNENQKSIGYRELKLLGKLLLFALPFIIVFGLPIIYMYQAGEFMSYQSIQARRMAGPVMVDLTYSGQTYYLDLDAVLKNKPEILALGSSRTEEIRSDFFNKGVKEYTVTPLIQNINNFQQFIDQIPTSSSPKVLILGLDQKFFDPGYTDADPGNVDDITPLLMQKDLPATTVLGNWWAHWTSLYQYYFQGNLPLSEFFHPSSTTIGIWALANGTGFRDDGSYDPGPQIYSPGITTEFLSEMGAGIDGFEYSNTVSSQALQAISSLLENCKVRNIYVIGFIPPMSPEVYSTMLSMGDDLSYVSLIDGELQPIFNKYGFAVFDFTNPASLNLTETDMMDGLHPTERTTLKMLVEMAKANPVLGEYMNPSWMQEQLDDNSSQVNVISR